MDVRFLADENLPRTVVDELRARGHDVVWVKESMRGSDDPTILQHAQSELRILLTQDKDFGELAFRHGLPAECGIILFRMTGDNPAREKQRMVEAVDSRTDWPGNFAVVEEHRVRIRPLF